ncbi:hypothetical protein XELAEV_18028804mg [Xenopus laevis]|uniref:Beta-soluble NSF attachment protein n=2 Tax=cellular organisms TaxID=131567 RepID=A0A974CQE3_XENLA|nr:hypothetical protein XELAEV_18028804mg [Xenopus laevis]
MCLFLCVSFSVCLCVSLSLCVCLSVSLSLCVYVSLCLFLCVSFSVSVSLCVTVSFTVFPCLFLSVCLYLCVFLPLSVCLFSQRVSFSLCLSLCLFLFLSVSFSVSLFLSLSLCVFLFLSVSVSVSLSLCLSLCHCVFLCVSFSLCVCSYVSLCVCHCLSVSVCVSVSLCVVSFSLCLSLCVCVSVSLCLSLCVSLSLSLSVGKCLMSQTNLVKGKIKLFYISIAVQNNCPCTELVCAPDPTSLLYRNSPFYWRQGRGNTKVEEACEMYARAANMFKMVKNWTAAGNAFCQAAKLHMQLQSKHDAATSFVDAGNAYKKADPQEAINCLNAAIDIYTDMGRFTIAAKHHITIAEIYETELVDIEKAIAHYEQSADYYKGEESNSSANKCLLKVATYAAQLEQYQKAIEIYEQVGASTMDNPLLKYSAKEYFFKAALCHFIVDELNAKLALEKYEEMFPAFTDSRECKLLKKLLEAHEEQNCDAYTEAVKEFDSISRLDQWLTTMLLRIKKSIQGDGDGDLK